MRMFVSLAVLGAVALMPVFPLAAQTPAASPASAAAAAPPGPNPPAEVPHVHVRYSFTPVALHGYTAVSPAEMYNPQRGYGFDLGSKVFMDNKPGSAAGCVTGVNGKPFFFSVAVPPGIYHVTVTLGSPYAAATTTVKSETRRLQVESLHTAARSVENCDFLVHIRTPGIPDSAGGGEVKLKQRESDPVLYVRWDPKKPDDLVPFTELDWDEKLTLAFTGDHPAIDSLEIQAVPHPTTVYLIGDSTMTDQMMEPWAAWGQMFPRFFQPTVCVANYAECGETTASFIGEKRWAKVMSEIQPGDYVFMQFGINDQMMPVDRFAQYFVKFIDDTRAKGATPVLVTSQNLKRLDAEGHAVQTLRGFPDAMKKVAEDKHAALIDLNAMSMKFYEALGPDNLGKAFTDGTHHSDYGAYELAKCVVQGVKDSGLPLAKAVVADWKPFDPAKPDPLASFALPPDVQWDPAFDSPTKTSPAGLGVMAGAAPRGRGGAASQTRPARGGG
ncbi:MAG TPA: rhamnogalacturonan acetylesterase [Phycisphaerae bacterium]|nr:rhamnogalacturonan acetylesterase [Phycisphaerae bacterium]